MWKWMRPHQSGWDGTVINYSIRHKCTHTHTHTYVYVCVSVQVCVCYIFLWVFTVYLLFLTLCLLLAQNFVGLSVLDGYIVCGSETNEVKYLISKFTLLMLIQDFLWCKYFEIGMIICRHGRACCLIADISDL